MSSYDVFISYSRRDNAQGRITQLVKRIESDFFAFAGRPLKLFFDISPENGIKGMEDWRHKILQGLRESRLLLACLSPAYLESQYCGWEFNEYLKHEISRAYFSEGIAPIYFVEVPGWENKGFDQKCDAWVAELRRRHYFDLRPWFHAGEESLRNAEVKEKIDQLNIQINNRINQAEWMENSLGNTDRHNPHFIGRTMELRRLREAVSLGKVGVITAVHGLGGVGKTALAVEYAHAFAREYGGGCWQVRCEGKDNLFAAISELSVPLALKINDDEQKNAERQFQRVIAELRRLADIHEPHRCLILLDNVDKPKLLEPEQTQHIPAADWMHILVTTRLGASDLYGKHMDRTFLPVDILPEDDALELIQTYQPGRIFQSADERESARQIIKLLGYFTLAVETAAVYLGYFADDVTCAGFLARLQKEGLAGLDHVAAQTAEGILHGEKRLTATLQPTLERLSDAEKSALIYAAFLPADHVVLPWIQTLIAQEYAEFGKASEPGYPDPWKNLLRRLLSLRLIEATNIIDIKGDQPIVKMHRLLREVAGHVYLENAVMKFTIKLRLGNLLLEEANKLYTEKINPLESWKLTPLSQAASLWLGNNELFSQKIGALCALLLKHAGRYADLLGVSEALISSQQVDALGSDISKAWCHNMAGVASLYIGDAERAEAHFANTQKYVEKDDPDKLDFLTGMGCLYRETYRPVLALPLLKEALSLSEKLYKRESSEVATCCANLGLAFQDLCNLEKAVELLKRAVDINRNKPNSVLILCQDMASLSDVLRNKWEDKDSRTMAVTALELAERNGYENHPTSAYLKATLAGILDDIGETKQARDLLQSALKIILECFGKTSKQAAMYLNNLGVNALANSDYEDAVNKFSQALDIERMAKKPQSLKLAHREMNLGIALLLKNKLGEAKSLINSGWNHIQGGYENSTLAARLLLIRHLIAVIQQEPGHIFRGQLAFIFSEHNLISPGLPIRWSAEKFIVSFIDKTIPHEREAFEWGCQMILVNAGIAIKSKTHQLLQLEKIPLTEQWPNS